MKKIIFQVTGFLFLIFCISFFSHTVKAQNILPLTVFPAVQDKVVNPGDRTRILIQFKNDSDDVVTGQVKVADYIIGDKEGTPTLVENAPIQPKYAASSWVRLSESVISIPPRDYIAVNAIVDVPQDISTCGKYALIYFQPNEASMNTVLAGDNTNSATSIMTKIGGLINFKVNQKECKSGIKLAKIETPLFLEYGPVELKFELYNSGDIHITPKGYVNLINTFGQTADQKILQEQRLFPESIKQYQVNLGNKWMLGRYKLTINASNDEGKTINQTVYIWALPWKIVTVVILSITIIIILTRKVIFGYTSVKEHNLQLEIEREKEEIEKLKEQLKKRKD